MTHDTIKTGRPRNEKIIRTKGPQQGLAEGWTRATFIVKNENLKTLKDYAYTERITIKEAMQMALDQFVERINGPLLKEKNMKCTEEELIKNLKELHEYYWNLGKKLHAEGGKSPNRAYEAGEVSGALQTVDTILLLVIGGKAMYQILENNWNNG